MFIESAKGYYQVSPENYDDGVRVEVTMTYNEMRDLLAAYDPASSTSPAVTLVRPLVRAMLDAVIADGGVPTSPPA